MLSQRVDNPAAYRDGAERLEKRRSVRDPGIRVEDLMKDPVALMAKLTEAAAAGSPIEGPTTTGGAGPTTPAAGDFDDTPIIFAPKVGLKRSTATHYRRGSLRRGERIGSKRSSRPEDEDPMPPGFRLQRSNTEPLPPGVSLVSEEQAEQAEAKDQVRPLRGSLPASNKVLEAVEKVEEKERCRSAPAAPAAGGRKRGGSEPKPVGGQQEGGIVVAKQRSSETPVVPVIVETPPPPVIELPERKASLPSGISSAKGRKSEELEPKPSVGDKDKEKEKDAKKLKPTSSGSVKDRKTSWGWLLGSDSKSSKAEDTNKEDTASKSSSSQSPGAGSGKKKRPKSSEKLTKDRDRDKVDRDKAAERERFDKEKISKEKQEKEDRARGTRLDLLQKSIETSSSVSVVSPSSSSFSSSSSSSSDEPPVKAAAKEPTTSSSTTNSFLSFFGGSRKKSSEHHASNQSSGQGSDKGTDKGTAKRATTPEQKQQQPAFYYTRFPIHIERAIYRLSHLKLANPRRPLQQQVCFVILWEGVIARKRV